MFNLFEFVFGYKKRKIEKENAKWPSGKEVAWKYNRHAKKKETDIHWLEYHMSKEQMKELKIGKL